MAEVSCTEQPVESACLTKEDLKLDDEDGEIDIIGIRTEERKESSGNACTDKLNNMKKVLSTEALSLQSSVSSKLTKTTNEQDSQLTVQKGLEDQLPLNSDQDLKDSINLENNISANICGDDKNKPVETQITVTDKLTTDITYNDKLRLEISKPASGVKHFNTEVTTADSVNDEESSLSSTCSSRKSSRRNSINSSETSKNNMDFEKQEAFDQEMLGDAGQDNQLSDDEEEEFKTNDPYERFFFESDYLALKDNKHYHLLLQTLVALEGQRMQAIKDLDTLCEEEAKALDDPVGFVEKLQNNEPLELPIGQNIVKLPNVPWEVYASSIGPLENLSAHPHTRGATNQVEKVQQIPPSNLINSCVSEKSSAFNRESETIFSETVKSTSNVPGNSFDSSKLPTFNQQWTTEEQTRLEKLLQVYPQEEIESKRWEKIAKALGNRTPKQVASRIQKYFIKLAKAGLPIPGRIPNVPKSGSRTSKKFAHYQTLGFRNSTFFPSYQPRVYMDDNGDDDDESSVAFSDDTSYLSDDDSISDELRQTNEYKELLELKKIKRQKLRHADQQQQQTAASHTGYMCDGCSITPIVGSRWHCQDCPDDKSVDFCSSCFEKGMSESRGHNRQHRLEPITRDSFFIDGDYVGMSGSTTGYNYLDPNFLPAAS